MLGISFKSSNRLEKKSVVTPNDPNIIYKAVYENSFIKLEISFFNQGDNLSVWIIKNQEQYFTLSEYLKHKNREDDLNSIERKSGEDIIQYLTRYLNFTHELLKTDLKPIIEGKTWEEVSRDWMGYR